MAFDLKIKDGIIQATFRERLTSTDLRRLADAVGKIEEEYKVSPDRIADLSATEGVDIDYAAMEAFAERRRNAPLRNNVKSAIVTAKSIQFGFARMYQTLNENPKINLKIFTDSKSAYEWLAAKATHNAHSP